MVVETRRPTPLVDDDADVVHPLCAACFRDARGLRVAGGVEFMLDLWSAEANLRPFYETGGPPEAGPLPTPIP
ncbi:hypothetical protein ACWDRB_66655 [Nonomuraea sp. NPDC003707]